MLVEYAVMAISEVVPLAVVALGDAHLARAMLTGFTELLVVLVIMSFTTLFAAQHVRHAVVIAVPPDQALEAHRMYLRIDPSPTGAITGPAVEQALALFSTEVEERRWVPSDTIVISQNRAKENVYTPSQLAASTPPVSMPTAPSVASMHVVALHQCPDELVPSLEMVSRQRESNVISETLGMNNLHLPSLKTARKQSVTSFVPASIEGEGQLARAAVYIQERNKHYLFASNEFPHRSPKVPPDKQFIVVNNEMKAGNACTSPIRYSEGEIESERHSDERLIESEEVIEALGIAERWRSVREPLICDWKTVQDGVTCFAVSQEASAARGADDAVALF